MIGGGKETMEEKREKTDRPIDRQINCERLKGNI
jgi:hypothetical protein